MQPFRTAVAAAKTYPSGKPNTILTLSRLPKTAIHSDVRRAIAGRGVTKELKVQIGYKDFSPTGQAFVTFVNEQHAQAAKTLLQNVQIGSRTLDVDISNGWGSTSSRDDLGTGPDAKMIERGKGVLLRGLPGFLTIDRIPRLIPRGIDLQDVPNSITQLPLRTSRTTRFYILTKSPEDAHRLVRRMHMLPFDSTMSRTLKGGPYIIRAHVVY